MKQIVWFEQDPFVAQAVIAFWRDRETKVYLESSVEDFSYILKDLSPDLIVANYQLIALDKESFVEQLCSDEKTAKIPLVVLADKNMNVDKSLSPLNLVGSLELPLNVIKIEENLKKLLKMPV